MIARVQLATPSGLGLALAILCSAGQAAGDVGAANAGSGGTPAGDSWSSMVPDLAAGSRIYEARCASCHDTPQERAPSKQALRGLTPSHIVAVLTDGAMRTMA